MIYITAPFYEKGLRTALLSKEHLLKHKVINASDYSQILDEELIALSFQGAVDTLMDLKPQDFDPTINVVRQPDLDIHQITHFKIVQDIYYDEVNQCFQTKILAIAPVVARYDDIGNFTFYESLFYVVYDEDFLK